MSAGERASMEKVHADPDPSVLFRPQISGSFPRNRYALTPRPSPPASVMNRRVGEGAGGSRSSTSPHLRRRQDHHRPEEGAMNAPRRGRTSSGLRNYLSHPFRKLRVERPSSFS